MCNKAARIFRRTLGIPLKPMHDTDTMQAGIEKIGEEMYWKSFHIVDGDHWTSEEEAIKSLGGFFPMGKAVQLIIQVPPILKFLMFILRNMQQRRALQCSIP